MTKIRPSCLLIGVHSWDTSMVWDVLELRYWDPAVFYFQLQRNLLIGNVVIFFCYPKKDRVLYWQLLARVVL